MRHAVSAQQMAGHPAREVVQWHRVRSVQRLLWVMGEDGARTLPGVRSEHLHAECTSPIASLVGQMLLSTHGRSLKQ